MAFENTDIKNEYPELQKQIEELGKLIVQLEKRVKLLENEEPIEPAPDGVEEWRPWNGLPYGAGGVGIYMTGNIVLVENKKYESMIDNNTYNPLAVDERVWKKI